MRMRFWAALAAGALLLWGGAAIAQNTVCPTMPLGDSTTACASTQFVQQNGGSTPTMTVGSTVINSGTSTRILFDNAGVLGERAPSGTGTTVATTTGSLPSGDCVKFDASGNVIDAGQACGTITALTGDVTASGNGSVAATLAWISRVAGKTLTLNNTLTFAGTDSTTMTFPSTNGTVAALNIAGQTLTGGATVTSSNLGTVSSGTLTINCGTVPLQFFTNNGAFTLAAPASDSSCMVLMTNGASAGAVSFSGFTVGSSTGDALTTTNTQSFTFSIWRINGVSGYRVAAHQ